MSTTGLTKPSSFIRDICFIQDFQRIPIAGDKSICVSKRPGEFHITLSYFEDEIKRDSVNKLKERIIKHATPFHIMADVDLCFIGEEVSKAVHGLFQLGELSDEGYRLLCDKNKQYTACLQYGRKAVGTFTKAQEDIFRELIDTQLQEVINGVPTLQEAVFTMAYILCDPRFRETLDSRYLAIADDMQYLAKIMDGDSAMETTYERLSEQTPSLTTQRTLFVTEALKHIRAKFPEMAIVDRFFTELELQGFIEKPSYAPPGSTRETVIQYGKSGLHSLTYRKHGIDIAITNLLAGYSLNEHARLQEEFELPRMAYFKKIVQRLSWRTTSQ